jgi:hypothetical protein
MSSPLLALFDRSLRADTRAKWTYSLRGGVATLLLLGVFLEATKALGSGTPAVNGIQLFDALMWLQGMVVTGLGVSWFASAITEEKEETTLGLLRMTNLNPLSLLLGKSTSRLCGALFLLFAPLPFAMLTVTLGGLSLEQIQAAYCTLFAYTFLVSNLALLWSVLMASTAGAAFGTAATLLGFFAAPSLLRELRDALLSMDWLADGAAVERGMQALSMELRLMSPVERFTAIMKTGFAGQPAGWQVGSNLLLGTLCFVLAWVVFARFADRAQERLATGQSFERGGARLTGTKLPRAWKNALAWKDFQVLGGGWPAFVPRFIVYGIAVAGAIFGRKNGEPTNLGMAFCFVAVGGPVVELTAMAAKIFGAELREHTWANLAVLPMTTGQIIRAKFLGALLACLPAFGAVGAMFWFWIATDRALPQPGKTSLTTILVAAVIAAIAASLFVALLSLRVRHGASLGLVGVVALWIMLRNAHAEVLGIFFHGFIILVMWTELHRQLEELAGDG